MKQLQNLDKETIIQKFNLLNEVELNSIVRLIHNSEVKKLETHQLISRFVEVFKPAPLIVHSKLFNVKHIIGVLAIDKNKQGYLNYNYYDSVFSVDMDKEHNYNAVHAILKQARAYCEKEGVTLIMC